MGVALKDILEYDDITIDKLSNKKIAIDTFNMLYQFLASIRQSDGNPLTDSKGNVTSHLKGLFNRLIYFKKNNIKAIFVFDGVAPKLKEKERELRREKKIEADKKYKEAVDMGLMEEARKYASGTTKLETFMIEEAKEIIKAFGFPIIEAPSEGEAQAAYMAKQGDLFAAASQDFDSLLFGAQYLIRNVSVSAKRKVAGTSQYKDVSIEYYDLNKILDTLHISQEELIHVAIMCGTDFNPGGIKGIGPKKALKLIKEYRGREDELYKTLDWHSYFTHTWVEVYNIFHKMPVNKEYELEFSEMKRDSIKEILVKKDFSEDMIERQLKGVKNVKTLDSFFG
ncbi:MAG: flap endonuclease-1 [Nanoarchaeota archaeon]|nr:flap endonuclease-1 [Nanoarchaeota archaeon]